MTIDVICKYLGTKYVCMYEYKKNNIAEMIKLIL